MGRKRGDPIKLMVYEQVDMAKGSMKHWSRQLRAKILKKVYKPVERVDIDPREIDTPEKIKEFVAERYGRGTFDIRGWSHGKTKFRVKLVRLALVTITNITPEGKVVGLIQYTSRKCRSPRLVRYWFWKGGH